MRKRYIIIEGTTLILTDQLDWNHKCKRIKNKRSRKNKTYKGFCILFIIFKRWNAFYIFTLSMTVYIFKMALARSLPYGNISILWIKLEIGTLKISLLFRKPYLIWPSLSNSISRKASIIPWWLSMTKKMSS